MKLSELITDDLIFPSLDGKDASSVLTELARGVCAAGRYNNEKLLFERLYEREQQGSTGIGNGIAIPHCKLDLLRQVVVAVAYSSDGVDFQAIDGRPIHFFFLVVSPSNASVLHLRALAAISRLLKSSRFVEGLKNRPGKKELLELIRQEEDAASVIS